MWPKKSVCSLLCYEAIEKMLLKNEVKEDLFDVSNGRNLDKLLLVVYGGWLVLFSVWS